MADVCKECDGPARAANHLDVIAAYTGNLRQCVRSARVSYCGNVAAQQTPIADPREAFRERLIDVERAQLNLQWVREAIVHEGHGWRHRALSTLGDARMYIDRAAALIEGEPGHG